MTPLYSTEGSLSELPRIAEQVLHLIKEARPFCLWLRAEMGTGKTTFAGALMRSLGVDPRIPIQSPTFTIVNDYEIKGESYAHIDFYRVGKDFSLAELGLMDHQEYRGFLVEWPDTPKPEQTIPPTHILDISVVDDHTRLFQLFACH